MTPEESIEPVIRSRGPAAPGQEERLDRLLELLGKASLPFWDDAAALKEYIGRSGLSQSACAKRLGRSQASVANRLRILRLPEPVRNRMRAHGLTERHARALLRLPGEAEQQSALDEILRGGLNVARTEELIEERLSRTGELDAEASFAPLLSELERLRARLPDIEYRLAESPETIRFLILIPRRYDQ